MRFQEPILILLHASVSIKLAGTTAAIPCTHTNPILQKQASKLQLILAIFRLILEQNTDSIQLPHTHFFIKKKKTDKKGANIYNIHHNSGQRYEMQNLSDFHWGLDPARLALSSTNRVSV